MERQDTMETAREAVEEPLLLSTEPPLSSQVVEEVEEQSLVV